MSKEKTPYTSTAPKRGKLVKAPTKAKIKTMKRKADDEDDTQTPPQTQQGVASPLRVLHKTPGLSPEEYTELLRQMTGPVTDSVINTYRTMAYLLSEVKSTVEHEKAIRDKETKDEKEYQDWRASEGKPRTPMQDGDNPDTRMMKALAPENFPPHRVDQHSPEQYGQRAGIKAGDRRHKRLKKIASQPVRVKVSRAIKKGVRRVEKGTAESLSRAGKAVRRAEKAVQIPWATTQKDESVIRTYATFAELIMEREDREQDLEKMTTKQKVLAQVAARSGSDKAKRDLGWKYKLNVPGRRGAPEIGRPYKIINKKGKEGWEWKKPKEQFRPGIDRSSLPRAKK